VVDGDYATCDRLTVFFSIAQIRAQMETNFFGALAVTKGAIPTFRERRSGTIVMISSASGFSGTPSQSMYSGSKFALEGVSESLADELAPFGIRVLIVELGAFRTPFQSAVDKQVISEPYKDTIADKTAQRITAGHGRQAGDPVKAAQAIVEVVASTGRGADLKDILRLPLGRDAVTRAHAKIDSFSSDVGRCRELANWASFDVPYDGYPPL
jgi:NAD(P)-dependent dehydrogenase (short-subunit alcohol dehydrogenase family)